MVNAETPDNPSRKVVTPNAHLPSIPATFGSILLQVCRCLMPMPAVAGNKDHAAKMVVGNALKVEGNSRAAREEVKDVPATRLFWHWILMKTANFPLLNYRTHLRLCVDSIATKTDSCHVRKPVLPMANAVGKVVNEVAVVVKVVNKVDRRNPEALDRKVLAPRAKPKMGKCANPGFLCTARKLMPMAMESFRARKC